MQKMLYNRLQTKHMPGQKATGHMFKFLFPLVSKRKFRDHVVEDFCLFSQLFSFLGN